MFGYRRGSFRKQLNPCKRQALQAQLISLEARRAIFKNPYNKMIKAPFWKLFTPNQQERPNYQKDQLVVLRMVRQIFPNYQVLSLTTVLIVSISAIFCAQAFYYELQENTFLKILHKNSPPFMKPELISVNHAQHFFSIFTNNFVHFDYLHLISNLLGIFLLGQLQGCIGFVKYLLGVIIIPLMTSMSLVLLNQSLQFNIYGGSSTIVFYGLGTLVSVSFILYLCVDQFNNICWLIQINLICIFLLINQIGHNSASTNPHTISLGYGIMWGAAVFPLGNKFLQESKTLKGICYGCIASLVVGFGLLVGFVIKSD